MDAEPLRTTTFLLTRADALAYEQAADRLSPLGVLGLLLWLGLCAASAWLLPADWAGARPGWSFSALVSLLAATGFVLALLVAALRQWLRAGRRLGRPHEVTIAEWPDRLEISGAGMPRELPLAAIRESILMRTHLFLVSDDGVLILPRRAFAEQGVVEALAARIAGRPAPAPVDPAPTSA